MTPQTMEATVRQFEFLELPNWHSHGLRINKFHNRDGFLRFSLIITPQKHIQLEVWDVRRDGFNESQAATPDLT